MGPRIFVSDKTCEYGFRDEEYLDGLSRAHDVREKKNLWHLFVNQGSHTNTDARRGVISGRPSSNL